MRKIRVGVIGASPLRPGWAVTAHLPALARLDAFELGAVATSNAESARAAERAYGVPAHHDARALIDRPDIDLVVVAVRLAFHHALVSNAIAARKMVMSEWPLGIDLDQAADLARRAAKAGVPTLVGLQARMAPMIRHARDLVAQGYVGKVLGTTMVGSGIAWTSVSDSAHAYMFDARSNATLLSVPVMHALDALQFVLGDLSDVRAASAIRNTRISLADTNTDIESTAPDHIAIAATLESGAIASIFFRGGTSRGENFRWEINGSEGDLVLTSPVGNLQVLAPALFGGTQADESVRPLDLPFGDALSGAAMDGPAANVARLYAAFADDLEVGRRGRSAPDFAHATRLQALLETIARATGPR